MLGTLARGTLLVLLVAACGASPALHPEASDSIAPQLAFQLVAECTSYQACLRSLDRAQSEAARCRGCASGVALVREVHARADALYLEENREAIEQEKRDRAPRPRATAPDPAINAARAAEAAEQARQRSVLAARAACVGSGELAQCDAEAATEDERAACRSDCETLGKAAAVDVMRQRLRSCVRDEGPASCPTVPWADEAAATACSKRCAELRRAWARYLATHALCCDGSRSPSCTNGDFGRGCCSHHGGGCLEAEPPSE